MPIFHQGEKTGVWWKDHSLSIVITFILAVQTVFLLYVGYTEWAADKNGHAPFVYWWLFEYVVSLVADTYGVLLIVVLSKWFVERGSAESN